ncbi:MAG: metal ABC transporter permease [Candidatus Babeliales bacterium]
MNIIIVPDITFWYALVIGISIGTVAAYIGSLMITNRMTLMAGALGHLTLPGIAIALKYHFDVSLGALLFLLVGIVIIWFLERQTRLPFEALTAIVFTTSVSIAFLFLPQSETETMLLGNIKHLTGIICLITVASSLIIFFITHYIFKRMILIGISADIAQTNKIPVSLYNFIYLLCIALVIALGVRILGGLMTAALVAIPGSTSKNISVNLTQYVYFSMIAGGLACALGTSAFYVTNLPVGSLIILAGTGLFALSCMMRAYYLSKKVHIQ